VHVAESVRSAIAAIRVGGVEETITASAGVAMLPDDGGDSVTLFKAADRALYAAKHAGRDCVRVAADGDSADAVSATSHDWLRGASPSPSPARGAATHYKLAAGLR
jgi:predicted signal transduction protein with EAL and GGDEF domain